MSRTIGIVLATRDGAYAAEALRAAVGLGLRGARVVIDARAGVPEDERSRRAIAALREAGHTVGGPVAGADVVEIWGGDAWRAEIDGASDDVLAAVVLAGVSERQEVLPAHPGAARDLRARARAGAGADERDGEPAVLDLRGEVCPFTFVRTKLALEPMARGGRLRVIVDHEPASRNVPRSATEWGQHVISVTSADEPGEKRWDIIIEKGTDPE